MSNFPSPEGPEDLPAHPETDETSAARDHVRRVNWASVLLIGLVGALVVAILVLHLTGVVGPAGHR